MTRSMTAAAVAISMALLAGCGSSEPEAPAVEHPTLSAYWSSIFSSQRELAELRDDQFLLAVLEDDWVTDEEWVSAQDLFYECMKAKGFTGWIDTIGQSITSGPTAGDNNKVTEGLTGDAADKALEELNEEAFECTTATVRAVGSAYAGPRTNPDGVTPDEVLSRCFIQAGYDDLGALSMDEVYALDYATPFDGVALECVNNPSYESNR